MAHENGTVEPRVLDGCGNRCGHILGITPRLQGGGATMAGKVEHQHLPFRVVSVRAVAVGAGTTTRAVYALFGSKDGLVQALAQRTFALLMDRVTAVPSSGDPGRDLIACSVHGYRAFALEHPDLYRLFFTAELPRPPLSVRSTQTRTAALGQLVLLLERAQAAGLLGGHTVEDVTLVWDAVCTGLAMRGICGPIRPSEGARIWTATLQALLAGLGSTDQGRTTL